MQPYNNYNNYGTGYQPVPPIMPISEEQLLEQKKLQQKREIRQISFSMGCAIIGFLLMQFIVVIPISFIPQLKELYFNSDLFQNCFSMIGTELCCVALPFGVMALINRRRYDTPLVPNKPLKVWECTKWVGFAMMCSVLANIVVGYIVVFFDEIIGVDIEQTNPTTNPTVFGYVILALSTAVMPAICEEFAMRCCSLGLMKKYGKGFAVVSVAIVFGLVHANVSQFIFAFTVGLILGFVTVKTDSILPAVLTHGFSNGIYVVSEICENSLGEKAGNSSMYIMYAFWFFFGIVCLCLLAYEKKLFKSKEQKAIEAAEGKGSEKQILSFWQRMWAFLCPWMIAPFLILIVLTITSVK